VVRIGRGFPVPVPGPVNTATGPTFDSVGAGGRVGYGTTMSWNHTVTGNCIIMFTNVINPVSLTIKAGSTLFSEIGTYETYYSGFYFLAWQLLNSGLTGVQTMSVTASSGAYMTANTVSYNNVKSVGSLVQNVATSASATISLSPSSSQLAVAGFSSNYYVFSAGSPNLRSNQSGIGYPMAIVDGKSAPSATLVGSNAWGALGVLLS